MTLEAIDLVNAKIIIDCSPEQISGWLKVEKGLFISHERIDQPIWTDKLKAVRCTSIFGTVARSANNKVPRTSGGQIRNRINIDDRPYYCR